VTPIKLQVFETVFAFALVVVLAVYLKRRGIIQDKDSPVFAKLLTQAILPATIFHQLLLYPISLQKLLLVVAMIITGVISMVMAWATGRLLHFDRPTIGALMITSTFGSSALIGYPLIQFAFPHDPQALGDAILISELGVGLPIFTICPFVAMYFGESDTTHFSLVRTSAEYFRSPIFIAVALGIIAGQFNLPLDNPLIAPIIGGLRMMEGALAITACLILGLQLEFKQIQGLWLLIAVSVIVQMFLQPMIAALQADLFGFTAQQKQILVLISSLPSAVLGPVFATRYQCAANTASALVFVNIVLSIFIVPFVFAAVIT
jgi:predicted permease